MIPFVERPLFQRRLLTRLYSALFPLALYLAVLHSGVGWISPNGVMISDPDSVW